MSNLDLPTSGDTQNYFKSPLEGPNRVILGSFQICLRSREGRGWHGALYYTSPIVPPSGIGEEEGNYSRQRKGSSETSMELVTDAGVKGGALIASLPDQWA